MALTPGGTCWISPVSAATAAFSAGLETPAAGAVTRISPSASSVSVVAPSRTVAAYSFWVSARWPSSRVAFSTPTTSTPVAIGSRVPACPTRRVPASRPVRQPGAQRGHGVVDRAARGEPGGPGVPAAAHRDAGPADVHAALGPGRDLPLPGVVFLEHHGHVRLVRPAQHVDHRLGGVQRQAVGVPVSPRHGGPDQAVAGRQVRLE